MTIKDVEQKTGLGRSNIRFYEKEKLIEPVKNINNGYKDYSQKDADKIKKIAYLRTLGVSIQDIRSIIQQEITLYEVLKTQLPFQKSVLNAQFRFENVYYTYFHTFYSFSTLPN